MFKKDLAHQVMPLFLRYLVVTIAIPVASHQHYILVLNNIFKKLKIIIKNLTSDELIILSSPCF